MLPQQQQAQRDTPFKLKCTPLWLIETHIVNSSNSFFSGAFRRGAALSSNP
jgi:hypothetical protein